MIDIFYSFYDRNNYNRFSSYLTNEEISLLSSILNEKKRYETFFSHSLLKYSLSEMGEKKYVLDFSTQTKPKIYNSTYTFNISHSNSVGAVAISNDEVGLDIEINRELDKNSLILLCNKVNIPITNSLDFLNCWTIKESYLKLLGIGLVYDLSNIIIDYDSLTVSYKNYPVANYRSFIYDNIVFSISSFTKIDYILTKVD